MFLEQKRSSYIINENFNIGNSLLVGMQSDKVSFTRIQGEYKFALIHVEIFLNAMLIYTEATLEGSECL